VPKKETVGQTIDKPRIIISFDEMPDGTYGNVFRSGNFEINP
jgi:hypothetical protein